MTRRRLFGALFFAAGVGAVVAIVAGDRNAISLRMWLAVTALWFAATSVRELLEVVPLDESRFRLLVRWQRKSTDAPSPRHWGLRELDSLVSRAAGNERVFENQLRPRLHELADHFLPLNHSVDRTKHPERVAAIFGDVHWMMNPQATGRAPSLDEIETFIHRLMPDARNALEGPT